MYFSDSVCLLAGFHLSQNKALNVCMVDFGIFLSFSKNVKHEVIRKMGVSRPR